MKKFLFRLWQWTWGFPQTLIGAILYLIHRKQPHGEYHGCVVTYWDVSGSLGVGMFLFIDKRHYQQSPEIMVHEFGHAVQSAILGPLFLPIMGVPSFLWCNLPHAGSSAGRSTYPTTASTPKAPQTALARWSPGRIVA